MFIVYRKGQIVTQITAWGLGRERTLEGESCRYRFPKFDVDCGTTTELEALLITSGAIIPPKKPPADSRDGLDDESDEEVTSERRSKSTWVNYSTKNVRNASKNGDSDSDFDL
jgi:hypothetical protein